MTQSVREKMYHLVGVVGTIKTLKTIDKLILSVIKLLTESKLISES